MTEDFRHVPYDIEIEQALLGAMLADNSIIDAASSELDPRHFYDPLHQRLFEIIAYLVSEGDVTPLIVHSVLKSDRGLHEVGGLGYLAGLVQAAPAMPSVTDLARILRDLTARRKFIDIGEQMVNAAYSQPREMPSAKISSDAIDALLETGAPNQNRLVSLHSVMMNSLTDVEVRLHGGQTFLSLTTGIPKLDRVIGGLQPADRLIIAGRSGMGKSALAGIFSRASAQAGAPTLVISADMGAKDWGDRTLCEVDCLLNPGARPIHYTKFRNGTLSNKEIERLTYAANIMAEWPIDICDEGVISVPMIRARARAMAKRHPGKQGRLIVDFVQKIQPERKPFEDLRRDQEVTAVTYALGDIVKDIGWDLVALAQMKNRGVDAQGNLRENYPNEADISESGGIQNAADIIIAPWRKAYFIERREPEGRDWAGGASPDWLTWDGERKEHEHSMRLIGFKNRSGRASALNIDLWCDMGSSAIRDEKPEPITPEAQAAVDLAMN